MAKLVQMREDTPDFAANARGEHRAGAGLDMMRHVNDGDSECFFGVVRRTDEGGRER